MADIDLPGKSFEYDLCFLFAGPDPAFHMAPLVMEPYSNLFLRHEGSLTSGSIFYYTEERVQIDLEIN